MKTSLFQFSQRSRGRILVSWLTEKQTPPGVQWLHDFHLVDRADSSVPPPRGWVLLHFCQKTLKGLEFGPSVTPISPVETHAKSISFQLSNSLTSNDIFKKETIWLSSLEINWIINFS